MRSRAARAHGRSARHGYPLEVWGAAGVPVFIEGARDGFPRALAAMAPRMQTMLLALLRHSGVLTGAEAEELRAAGDAVWRDSRLSRDAGPNSWSPGPSPAPAPLLP